MAINTLAAATLFMTMLDKVAVQEENVTAVVYQNGREVTKNYPAAWFSWRKKTESGESFLGYGYSIKVKNEDYMFGGVVIGRFTTYKTAALIVGGKLLVIGGKAVNLNVDAV